MCSLLRFPGPGRSQHVTGYMILSNEYMSLKNLSVTPHDELSLECDVHPHISSLR